LDLTGKKKVNQLLPSSPLARPTDTYLKPLKPIPLLSKSNVVKPLPPPIDGKGLGFVNASTTDTGGVGGVGLVGAANIASAIGTVVDIGASLYGASQAAKMKPNLPVPFIPVEAKLQDDNTSAIVSAQTEKIDKAIETNRDDFTKKGIVGVNGILASKEMESLNDLSSRIAEYRGGIERANVATQNQTIQYNSQAKQQSELNRSQIINDFEKYKSSILGQGIGNATNALNSGVSSIFNNTLQAEGLGLQADNNELEALAASDKPSANYLYNKALEKKLAREKRIFGNV